MTLERRIWILQWTEGVSVIPKVQMSRDHKKWSLLIQWKNANKEKSQWHYW